MQKKVPCLKISAPSAARQSDLPMLSQFWKVLDQWGTLPASNPVALVPDRSSNERNFSYTAIGNQRHRIRSGITPSLSELSAIYFAQPRLCYGREHRRGRRVKP